MWFLRVLFSVALLSICIAPAFKTDLEITLRAGFDGFCRLRRLCPVRVELRNTGHAELRGTVHISQPGSELLSSPDYIYAETVSLPAGGRLLIETRLKPETDAYPVVAEFQSSGSSPDPTAEAGLRATTAGVVLALSRSRSFDFLQRELPGSAVVYPHYEKLPAEWRSYEAVRLLILDDQPLPDSHALEAWATWVYAGGELWINLSAHGGNQSPLLSLFDSIPDRHTAVEWEALAHGAGRIRLYRTPPSSWSSDELRSIGRLADSFPGSLLTTARKALIRPAPGALHPAVHPLERNLPILFLPLSALLSAGIVAAITLALRSSGRRFGALLLAGFLVSGGYLLILSPRFDRGAEAELKQYVGRGEEAALVVRYRTFLGRKREQGPKGPVISAPGLFELFYPGITGRGGTLRPREPRPWTPFLFAEVETGRSPFGYRHDHSPPRLINQGSERLVEVLRIDSSGVDLLPEIPPGETLPLLQTKRVEPSSARVPRFVRELARFSIDSGRTSTFFTARGELSGDRAVIEVSP